MIRCTKCGTENDTNFKFCCMCGNELAADVSSDTENIIFEEDANSIVDSENDTNETIKHEEESYYKDNNLNTYEKIKISMVVYKDNILNLYKKIKNSVFFKTKRNGFITLGVLGFALVSIVVFVNSGFLFFKNSYSEGDYESAKRISNWSFNTKSVEMKIEKFLLEEANIYYDKYFDNSITYDEAEKGLEIITAINGNISDVKEKLDNLYNSRNAYIHAQEHFDNGQIYEAILEYKKVIDIDNNFKDAQEKTEKYKSELKVQLIAQLDNCVAISDFEGGFKLLDKINEIYASDSDFDKYDSTFNNMKKEYELQQRISKLRSIVRVSRVFPGTPNSAGGVNLYVIWTNMSEKTVKYAYFTVKPYNAVDDVVTCEIRDYSNYTARDDGPKAKGEGNPSTYWRWENAWYNNSIKRVELTKVRIEYMDGTSEEITGEDLKYIQY